jgi:hypothetical protein
MIMRRLLKHLKDQAWAAIWIELVIVVIGVFIGIQVSNWNAQRATDRQARIFTERLRDDLRVEVWRFKATNLYYDDVQANARRTLAALEGRSALTNDALLVAAYRATQYGEFAQYRATYDELTSTGNIGLITDPTLRKMANEIYSSAFYQNVKNEGINSRYRVAFRMLVPTEIQAALAEQCGDRAAEIGDYAGIITPLDYPCTVDLPPQAIDRAALALRADVSLVPLLRLRIADMGSAVSTQLMSADVLASLKILARKAPGSGATP